MKKLKLMKPLSMFLILTMVLSILWGYGNTGLKAEAASTTGLFTGKYGQAQVFDCQRSPAFPVANQPFRASGFKNMFNSVNGGQFPTSIWGTNTDRYVQFVDKGTNNGDVALYLYESNGTFVQIISEGGQVWGLGSAGFLYVSTKTDNGYFISNSKGYAYGGSVTYTPTTGEVTITDTLSNYQATTTVLTNGQTASTAPVITATVNGSSYNGAWTSGNVQLVASGASGPSGIDHYEYKIGDGGTWAAMPDTDNATDDVTLNIISDKLTISNDMNGDVHIRAVSNTGVKGSESTFTVRRSTVTPVIGVSVTGTTGKWTEDPVTFTLSNTASDGSPVTYWVKIGTADWVQISGTTYAITGNVDTTYQFKTISASGLESTFSDAYTVRLSSDTLKDVLGAISNLPDPDTATDKQITDNSQVIKDTKILYDSLSSSEKNAISQAELDKLNKLLNRLNTLLVIVPSDEGTGITAGNLGTAVQLPELNDPNVSKVVVKLVVDPLSSGASQHANIAVATQNMSNSGKNILVAFDISLFKSVYDTSGAMMSNGKISNSSIDAPITIQIPVPSGYSGRTDLQVVYIDDSGNVTPLTTTLVTINDVQYLQFTTTHFSIYAITAKQETVANPKTGDNSLPIESALPVCLLILSALTMISVRRKRKMGNIR